MSLPIDPLRALSDALARAGQPVEHLEPDGEIHRYDPPDKGKGSQPCWYVAHRLSSGHVVAAFGDWRDGVTQRWRSWEEGVPPSALRAPPAAPSKPRPDPDQRRAQTRARWEQLSQTGYSPYLARKQAPGMGVRYQGDTVAVPLWGPDGLQGIQWILADGTKRFSRGAQPREAYHRLGPIQPKQPLLIAEGYATAASLHLATGHPVAVAFTAGNLDAVVGRLRREYPHHALVIAADNDHWTPGNPGLTKAREAAARHGATVIAPDFTGLDAAGKPTDFNDLARLAGVEEVRRQMQPQATPVPLATQSPAAEKPGVASATSPSEPTLPDWLERSAAATPEPARPAVPAPHGATLERAEVNAIAYDGPDPDKRQRPDSPSPALLKDFTVVVNRYYYKARPAVEAFVDHGDRLRTRHDSPEAVQGMLTLAESRGWDRLKVSGSNAFKQTVWLEARLRGLAVSGYQPTAQDQAALQERQQAREQKPGAATLRPATNPVPTAEWQPAAAVTPPPTPSVNDPALTASQRRQSRHYAIREQVIQHGRQERERQAAAAQATQHQRAVQEEKAKHLRTAFDTLDKRTAQERYPELASLYPLVAEATRFASEKMADPANRAAFVEQIKERGIEELARGETLPKLPNVAAKASSQHRQQERAAEVEP